MRPEAYETKLELTAMDTIEKYMEDGLSIKEAVDKWEKQTYTKLPDQIKALIREKPKALGYMDADTYRD